MDRETIKSTAFRNDETLYDKKIEPVIAPDKQIGIDLGNHVISNIVDSVETSRFDVNALNAFTNVSRSRNEIYDTLDAMGEDSTIAAILETYAEDATETNDQGNIVWCESSDSEVAKFVTYLLNSLNVDKNIYKWTHSLCKYGDVYLRLYRESEYEESIFDKVKKKKDPNNALNEDLKIKFYSKDDKYVHYLEQVDNPAQAFELTRFGKTAAYIKTSVDATSTKNNNLTNNTFVNKYSFNTNDIDLYPATEFVHGCLEDNTSRTPEEVELFVDDDSNPISYKVKRGQSLLYSTYKIWRQLMLLENSVLLNRVTQSSIVRVIGVEVGDMPKENVQVHMAQIKHLIEQKASLSVGNSMSEYTNPGPIINNVYVPIRNQQGNITTQQIGGDVKIGELADLGYYQDKFFGSMRVPKQYFGVTDDNAGFSGGESLSIISARYAKMIKRIQNTMIQMLTDAINLILIDTGNESYINNFTLKMLPPTTSEEVARRDNVSNKVGLVRDIMDIMGDIETPMIKLKILKSLLSDTITDSEVVSLIEEEIERLEAESSGEIPVEDDASFSEDEPLDLELSDTSTSSSNEINFDIEDSTVGETTEDEASSDEENLPSPAELDIGDMSDSTNPNLD
jgi:hypothetical protein